MDICNASKNFTESDSNKEAQLLYGGTDKYGIYQLKGDIEPDKLISGYGALPENYKLMCMGELTTTQGQTQLEKLEEILTKHKLHPSSFNGIAVLHENRKNRAYSIDPFGFTELPKFMLMLEGKEDGVQTELAVHIADRYILMHECDEGYDYSILDEQYHLLDGGVYDNLDITIQRAMNMIIADLKESRFSIVTGQYYRDKYLQGEVHDGSESESVDYTELSEKAVEAEQADLAVQQAEFKERYQEY